MITIEQVKKDDITSLSKFATEIVREHFDPIVGKEQNDYMLRKFQTAEAITEQIASGYRYYWVKYDGHKAGFVAFFPKDEKMYLSKFYVHKDFRGKHISHTMMDFVEDETRKQNLHAIFLNVSRHNDAVISIYKHLGFSVLRTENNDIGNGFYMDDYVLEKTL